MATIERNLILLSLLSSCFHILLMMPYCSAADTLAQGQVLRDGEQLVSAKGAFTLGFFSPGSSKLRYLGIWCNIGDDWTVTKDIGLLSDRRYLWVANRDNPISDDQSGALMIDEFGILMISYAGGNDVTYVPLSSIKTSGDSNTSAILLDSGNLVLRELDSDGSVKQDLWESFDHPTDTLVPGMKLGINFKTGQSWSLTSCRSYEVPGQGSYKIGGDPNGTRQLIIWWNGDIRWKSGPWQKDHFKFADLYIPVEPSTEKFTFSYISNENETYFTFSMTNNTKISRFAMDLDGEFTGSGLLSDFGKCGYGGSQAPGCVERKMPDCRGLDTGFSPVLRRVVVDGGEHISASQNGSVFDCQDRCFTDCSCAAFAYDETGCQIWRRGTRFEEVNESGREIYIYHFKKEKQKWWIWLVIASGVASLILILGSLCCKRQRKLRSEGKAKTEQDVLLNELGAYTTEANKSELEKNPNRDGKKSHELQFFSFATISSAANNFAFTNKLGQGGYGPVYKGKLENGQEVALKRLSKSSGQGLQEFKNELALIARLQHTNLVRLVGCCIEREEKMLIYEFMPNKSLDFFLFDSTKKHLLDWKKRFSIIEGIAQGLLYLHKHSRLRIIHRDLKTSNILLDADMNPKISDFGTAKIFGQNESEANTKRVVGTRGYMSPEYIKDGTFSIKSDVFSFGVMLLEIVSATKNTSFTLIEHTWELWRRDSCLEIVDQTLGGDLCDRNEMLRCIHVGLLCVQESPEDRPDMADVISMLTNERMPRPAPKQPAFVFNTSVIATKTETYSSNMVSMSEMEGR